jgi:hypothetical protein
VGRKRPLSRGRRNAENREVVHLELERVLDDGEAVGGQAVVREGLVAARRRRQLSREGMG